MGRRYGSVRALAVVLAVATGTALTGCSEPRSTFVPAPEGVPASGDTGTGEPAESGAASASPDPSPVARTRAVKVRWLSGASGDLAAKGSYGKWRHATVDIGGTWDNGNAEQVAMKSICPGGAWARWTKPLDLAIGAIDTTAGETWAAAAKGAYDARWRRSLTRMKACWGSRNPGNLYLRFAHEMNLSSMPWHVKKGEEASFIAAITRYSTLRYKILPRAKIVFCPTDGTDAALHLDIRNLWPGKDRSGRRVADIYSIDTYNAYLVVHTAEEFAGKANTTDQFGMLLGIETHRKFAESEGVPFAVSEWSNNGDPKDAGKGGEAPEYVRQMNIWFREHAGNSKTPGPGKLLYEIQFNLQHQFEFLPTKLQPRTAAAYRTLIWGH